MEFWTITRHAEVEWASQVDDQRALVPDADRDPTRIANQRDAD
jgi:hypothetical protein